MGIPQLLRCAAGKAGGMGSYRDFTGTFREQLQRLLVDTEVYSPGLGRWMGSGWERLGPDYHEDGTTITVVATVWRVLCAGA